MVKFNLNFPDELMEQVVEYGKSLNVNRTAAITILVTRGLQAEQSISLINKIFDEKNKPKED